MLIERNRDVNLADGWDGCCCCCRTLSTCFCWPLSSEPNSWFAWSLKCSSKPQNALHTCVIISFHHSIWVFKLSVTIHAAGHHWQRAEDKRKHYVIDSKLQEQQACFRQHSSSSDHGKWTTNRVELSDAFLFYWVAFHYVENIDSDNLHWGQSRQSYVYFQSYRQAVVFSTILIHTTVSAAASCCWQEGIQLEQSYLRELSRASGSASLMPFLMASYSADVWRSSTDVGHVCSSRAINSQHCLQHTTYSTGNCIHTTFSVSYHAVPPVHQWPSCHVLLEMTSVMLKLNAHLRQTFPAYLSTVRGNAWNQAQPSPQ